MIWTVCVFLFGFIFGICWADPLRKKQLFGFFKDCSTVWKKKKLFVVPFLAFSLIGCSTALREIKAGKEIIKETKSEILDVVLTKEEKKKLRQPSPPPVRKREVCRTAKPNWWSSPVTKCWYVYD